tara:strand:- start:141 stop:497 length:357 start_codon:yes stop_codon:yes gene_type:complete
MNIKKSRIIQIIKEEMQKMVEDDGDDSGLAPVSLTPPAPVTAPSDALATIEMQIRHLEGEIPKLQKRLAHLQRQQGELAGEEPEAPDFTDETDPQDETELAPVPAWVEKRYKDRMGED